MNRPTSRQPDAICTEPEITATITNNMGSSGTSWCRLYNEDARTLIDDIPLESVDLILTSPPYADLKDYACQGQIGFGQSFDEYLQDMRHVLDSCFKIAKPTATLWLVSDTFKRNGEVVNLPAELAGCARAVGWRLQDVIIWNKTKTLPWSHRGQVRRIFEYVYMFAKTRHYRYYPQRIREIEGIQDWWMKYPERYNPLGKTPHSIWCFPIPTQGSWGNGVVRHFNPFPPALVARIVDLTTNPGDIVFDPFAGSGTVLAQAECMGRLAAGMELNSHFAEHLYPKVRAAARETWDIQREERIQRDERAVKFDSLILRLRKIKLGKQLLRALSDSNAGEDTVSPGIIAGILVDATNDRSPGTVRHALGSVDLVVVATSTNVVERATARLHALCGRPPYSKYGIVVNAICTTAAALTNERPDWMTGQQAWFVYEAGSAHTPSCNIRPDDIATFCEADGGRRWTRKEIGPLFSPIRVSMQEMMQLREGLHPAA